jgi:hypothetical protein
MQVFGPIQIAISTKAVQIPVSYTFLLNPFVAVYSHFFPSKRKALLD